MTNIAISLLEENVYYNQPIKESKFNELVKSISQYGILEPLMVEKYKYNKYKIIDGNHRFKAAKLLNLTEVPCTIK